MFQAQAYNSEAFGEDKLALSSRFRENLQNQRGVPELSDYFCQARVEPHGMPTKDRIVNVPNS